MTPHPLQQLSLPRVQDLYEATLRLLGLLGAHRIETDLLQEGIDALTALIGTRYGAIGLVDEAGNLQQFVYTGITPQQARQISDLPQGKGLLGVVIQKNQVLNLDDMSKDARSAGFPPQHPPMKSLLAVPISYDGRVYGRVYLCDKFDGTPFNQQHDELLAKQYADLLVLVLTQHRAQAHHTDAEAMLRHIADAIAGSTGLAFFQRLVLSIAETMDMAMAFVGELDPKKQTVRTLAACAFGKIIDNITYSLDGTPCEQVLDKQEFCLYARDLLQQFPQGHPLAEKDSQSYLGVPLFNSVGQVVGLLALMDNKAITDHRSAHTILRILAARAAAEQERQRIEGLLRETATALENAVEGIARLDAEGHYIAVNKAYADMLGYTPEELVGTEWLATTHPDDRLMAQAACRRLPAEGKAEVSARSLRKDGSGFHQQMTMVGAYDQQKKFIGHYCFMRDISESVRTKQVLHESEERLRRVVENAPVCIHTIDLNGCVASMNLAGLCMLGLEKEEQVRGMAMLASVSEADRARIQAHLQDAFQGITSHFEFTTITGRIFKSSFIPVRAPAGQIQYLLGVTEDITEHKQAEAALRAGLQGLRALHAIISDQGLSFRAKIQALLSLGCQRFDLPIGILSHIDGDRYQIVEAVAPGTAIVSGSIYSTGRTYCNETMKSTDIVCFEHAIESEWKSHPAYADLKLEAYIALAVRVQGKAYGTINFSSPEPRLSLFTDTDKEILKLMAHWVESELHRQQTEAVSTRLGRILDDSSNEIYVFDAESLTFLQANQGARHNLGYSMEELARLTPLDLNPEHTRESFEAIIAPLQQGEQHMVVFFATHQRKDGSLYPVEVRLQLSSVDVPPVFVAIIQDITERRQVEERLSYLAHYDTLTGLPNRVLLQDRLHQAMIEADRHDRLVAVMFLDLDRFKIINDTLGHETGDALLKQVAERLLACVRAGDTIARLGGDEFTVVLANVALVDDVARIAQKIIDNFVSPFHIGGRELFVSTSIGITLYPFDDNSLDGLLRNADASMYQAKEMGRNTFQFYTVEINRRTTKRLALETALRHALERNELQLYYQPQVNLKTGKITGAEALLRWLHPEMGMIAPLEFIPLAEETGLIIPIGEWVLHTACAQAQAWHLAGFRGFQIAVNLSVRQVLHGNLAKVVKRVLKETGLDPRQLDLELTESLLMHNTETTLATMDELNVLGAVFSMDDFGTGYSSLSYLKRFPIDTLKIDQSFMRDIPGDPDDAAIAQAIIAMAHSLEIRVIAEGVETAKQLAFLRSHKCDGMQGYYFSKPIPAAAMTRLLEKDQRLKWRRPAKAKTRAAKVKVKKRRG